MDRIREEAGVLNLAVLLVLLVCLFSCTSSSHWALSQMHADKEEFRSTRLTWACPDPVHGIDLELLKTNEHLHVYLNTHSIPIPPYKGDAHTALLTVEIGDNKTEGFIYRLGGGQRFLLPEETASAIIAAFCQNQEVSLVLRGGYHTTISPEDFKGQFEKFLHPSAFENRFKTSYF